MKPKPSEASRAFAQLRDEALRLPVRDRAGLVVLLLESIEDPDASEESFDELWMEEARRRLRELVDGDVNGLPAEQVFAELRDKLAR